MSRVTTDIIDSYNHRQPSAIEAEQDLRGAPIAASVQPRSAVCLFVRDEARDIAEWLAYQIAVGFDALLVYDNGSADRTPNIVRTFGQRFDVRLVDWPMTEAWAQPAAYLDSLSRFGLGFEWIAFIDADELIVPRHGSIRDLLAPHVDTAAVVVNWAMFGSSGHTDRPPGMMIETFRRRAKSDFLPSRIVKYIARPSAVSQVHSPCMFDINGPIRTPAGEPVRWNNRLVSTVSAEHSVAQLNHYFTRSHAEWKRKIARGYRDRPDPKTKSSFAKFDRNDITDLGALRFAPAVREILQVARIDNAITVGRAA